MAERLDLLRTLYETSTDVLRSLERTGSVDAVTRSRVTRALAAVDQYEGTHGAATLYLRLHSGEVLDVPDNAKIVVDRHARGLPDVIVSPARAATLIESAGA